VHQGLRVINSVLDPRSVGLNVDIISHSINGSGLKGGFPPRSFKII